MSETNVHSHPEPPSNQPARASVEDAADLQEANARLLIAALQAQEQTETQVVLNTALRVFSAENARQRRTFEALLDASADHIFLLDPAGRFAYVNRAAVRTFAWTAPGIGPSSEVIIGRTARELGFSEDFLDHFEANHARALSGETSIGETRLPGPGGSRIFEYVLSPVRDEDGHTEFVVGVTRDVHDRKQAEAERERLLTLAQAARDQAEAALGVREEFLAIASHELRSPVTNVKGRAQMALRSLAEGELDKAAAEAQFQSIIHSADRLEALISDLLDVSRMRSGGPSIRIKVQDVAALVDAAARRCAEGPGAGHRVTVEIPDRPALLGVDAGRLEQVVDNLLNNAVKYSAPGTEIRTRLRWTVDGLCLTIADDGIGLDPGEHERIFEPFGRGSNATQQRLPGLGLGLYICRQIVEAHGGRIWAESPGTGRGTVVSVILPKR